MCNDRCKATVGGVRGNGVHVGCRGQVSKNKFFTYTPCCSTSQGLPMGMLNGFIDAPMHVEVGVVVVAVVHDVMLSR